MSNLGMREKLIAGGVVIGLLVTFIAVALIGISLGVKANDNVLAIEAANANIVGSNEELRAELDLLVDRGEFTASEADAQFEENKATATEITFDDRYSWIESTGIVAILTVGMLGIGVAVLIKRDESLPMTWAQNIVVAGILFYFLLLVNGVIPHFMITIWDNVWPKQQGTFTVPLTQAIGSWFESDALGWEWAWWVPRDMIVAGWYIVTLVAMIVCWYWTQKLLERESASSESKARISPYGRPTLSASK